MATKALTVEQVLDELPPDTLYQAMARAFEQIEGATKSATNPHFKSKYADIGKVIEAIKPALISNGLFFTQRSHPADNGVIVETVVSHRNGEEMSLGKLFVPSQRMDAQGFGSALTYARRYALLTAFGVPTEDDDGNDSGRDTDGGDATKPRGAGDMSDTALRGCVKALVHSLNGCGTIQDFDELMEVPETVATIEQCRRRFPNWWSTGLGMPAEFKPLQKIINETRDGLRALETQ